MKPIPVLKIKEMIDSIEKQGSDLSDYVLVTDKLLLPKDTDAIIINKLDLERNALPRNDSDKEG